VSFFLLYVLSLLLQSGGLSLLYPLFYQLIVLGTQGLFDHFITVLFVGHLAGILVGLLYIKGPLKPLMDSIIPPSKCVY